MQNMRMAASTREEMDEKGKKAKIKTTTYHCMVCNTFVKSEKNSSWY
jgi:hypothetical protein